MFSIESEKETGTKMVAIVDAETSSTLAIMLQDPQGNVSSKKQYKGYSVEFNVHDRRIQKYINVNVAYYVMAIHWPKFYRDSHSIQEKA